MCCHRHDKKKTIFPQRMGPVSLFHDLNLLLWSTLKTGDESHVYVRHGSRLANQRETYVQQWTVNTDDDDDDIFSIKMV